MAALLEDAYGDGRVPFRCGLGLARAGMAERAREAGLVGPAQHSEHGLRTGSALVLWGWCAFLVGGVIFAKFTDNWMAGTPSAGRAVASTGYGVVVACGVLGSVVVLGAALAVFPVFVRLARGPGWGAVRRPVVRAVASASLAVVLVGATVAWGHHLDAAQRNGALPAYGALWVLTGLAGSVALVSAARAAVAVARHAPVSRSVLRAAGIVALGLGALMVLVLSGVLTWWVAEAVRAPGVLRDGMGPGTPLLAGRVPAALLATGLAMVVGLVLAAAGAGRIAGALRRPWTT